MKATYSGDWLKDSMQVMWKFHRWNNASGRRLAAGARSRPGEARLGVSGCADRSLKIRAISTSRTDATVCNALPIEQACNLENTKLVQVSARRDALSRTRHLFGVNCTIPRIPARSKSGSAFSVVHRRGDAKCRRQFRASVDVVSDVVTGDETWFAAVPPLCTAPKRCESRLGGA